MSAPRIKNKMKHPRCDTSSISPTYATRTVPSAKCQHRLEVQECLLKRSCFTSSALRGSPMSLLFVFMSHWSLAFSLLLVGHDNQSVASVTFPRVGKKEERGRNPLIDAPSFLSTDRRCSHTESHTRLIIPPLHEE